MSTVEISGYVEGFEPNIFSKDPEIQISIICPQPDFVDVDATVLTGTVDDGTTKTTIGYFGTVPSGFVLRVSSTPARQAYTGIITIVNKTPFPQFFPVEATVDTTRYFEMSSVQGLKYVRTVAISGGIITNLLRTTAANVVWPKLEPGANDLSVGANSPGQEWKLTYFNRYGGL